MQYKIIERIDKYIRDKNKRNISVQYSVSYQKDEDIQINSDYRMEIDGYRENAVIVEAINCKEVVAKATMFIMPYEVYKEVFFWKLDSQKQNLLKKKLSDFKDCIGDYCVTFAFGQIKENVRKEQRIALKYDIIRFYIELCKIFLNEFCFFCYVEPTGINFFDYEMLTKEQINCNDNNVDIEKLGLVNEESVVAEKLAQYLCMKKQDDLYHGITGGPIYFSK